MKKTRQEEALEFIFSRRVCDYESRFKTLTPGLKITNLAEILSRVDGDVVASVPMPENVKKYVDRKMKLPA